MSLNRSVKPHNRNVCFAVIFGVFTNINAMASYPILYPRSKQVTTYKRANLPAIELAIKAHAKRHQCTLSDFAKAMGIMLPSLTRTLNQRDLRVSTLLGLCEAVSFNLFDNYIRLLPEHLRQTQETLMMQQQLDQKDAELEQLRQELDFAKHERDSYYKLLESRKS
jgi:transcriptional regulator with XRE-family HTH domain